MLKSCDKWTDAQGERVKLLFGMCPKIECRRTGVRRSFILKVVGINKFLMLLPDKNIFIEYICLYVKKNMLKLIIFIFTIYIFYTFAIEKANCYIKS